jgi:hypothetical protein
VNLQIIENLETGAPLKKFNPNSVLASPKIQLCLCKTRKKKIIIFLHEEAKRLPQKR